MQELESLCGSPSMQERPLPGLHPVPGPYGSRAWEVELKLDECNGVSEQQDSRRMPSSGQHGLSPPTEHFYLARVQPGHTRRQPVSGGGRRWGLLGSHQRALRLEFSSRI